MNIGNMCQYWNRGSVSKDIWDWEVIVKFPQVWDENVTDPPNQHHIGAQSGKRLLTILGNIEALKSVEKAS